MNTKSLPIVIACLLLLFGWQWFADKMWPPPPPGAKKSAVAGAAANALTATATPVPHKAAPPAIVAAPTATAAPVEPSKTRPPEQTAALENDFIRAEMTSYGGGIRDVVLKC
jgi:YidC/Oxa1 family membrane protein insertase